MKVLSVASRYSDQPEENVITISRIGDASCPRRYYKNYVETPRQPKPFESIELGIGQFFHSYVESHFKQIFAEDRALEDYDYIDTDDLIRRFRLSFIWEGKLREPYRIVGRRYTLKDFQDRLAGAAENFNDFVCAELPGQRIKCVEGELQIRTDACYIRGKYDLITVQGKNLVLWDWKTGRKPKPEYFDEYESLKAQLGVYATWMRYQYEGTNVRGTAVFLRDELAQQSEVFTPAVEQDVLAYMAGWRTRLNNMKSYPPVPSKLCDWCSWNEDCPAMEDLCVRGEELERQVREAEAKLQATVEKIRAKAESDRRLAEGTVPPSDRRCFVATVAFGNPACEELSVLRCFRDRWLLTCLPGRLFVDFYYRLGPSAARYVEKHPLICRAVRGVLRLAVSMLRRALPGLPVGSCPAEMDSDCVSKDQP